MGCGRSRPRSPSSQTSKEGKGGCDGEGDGGGGAEKKAGGGGGGGTKDRKGQRASDSKKTTARAGTKQNTDATSNGGAGDTKSHAQRGGATTRKEGVSARDGQTGEPMGAPAEEEVVVSKSSAPVSARAPHGSAHKPTSPSRHHANFSLLNGGSPSEAGAAARHKMQTDGHASAGDKMSTHASPGKPFHVTHSQQEFFKMLDEKIEKGADYAADN